MREDAHPQPAFTIIYSRLVGEERRKEGERGWEGRRRFKGKGQKKSGKRGGGVAVTTATELFDLSLGRRRMADNGGTAL